MRARTIRIALMMLLCANVRAADAPATEYIGDRLERLLHWRQGWGELGINTCAHLAGQPGLPLQIGERTYQRGLGHHAPGEIVLDLAGQYERFEAEVGVQTQPGRAGTVVFQVYVDDEKKSDSGIRRNGDPARPVAVSLTGAQELRLVATDAGDGINCDCADWAEARLVRDPNARAEVARATFDIAPFARVVGRDPARTDGARSSRIQEYRTEDVYLEWDLPKSAQGEYLVAAGPGGMGSIGLRWIERRIMRSLALELADGVPLPPPDRVQVLYWTGESPYQGEWRPLKGALDAAGATWTFQIAGPDNAEVLRAGTWKVCWVFPVGADPLRVRALHADMLATLRETDFRIEFDPPERGRQAKFEVYNGELVAAQPDRQILRIRHCRPRAWLAEQTIIRVRWPEDACSVAVDDVLREQAMYVPSLGLFIAPAAANIDLAGYRRQIAGRQTLLDEVRHRPDQTFAQAVAHVHHDRQDLQPTLLSLACDNHKFIVYRDGTTQFAPPGDTSLATKPDQPVYPCQFRPIFGSGQGGKLTRRLEGGWLPAPTVTVDDHGVVYRSCSFVMPHGPQPAGHDDPWLNDQPLYVAAITVNNTQEAAAEAAIQLAFATDAAQNLPARAQLNGPRALVYAADENAHAPADPLLAVVDAGARGPLTITTAGGIVSLRGTLAPRERFACWVFVPAWPLASDQAARLTGNERLFQDFAAYWQRLLAPAMQVQTPDELLNNVIRASQVHCLIAARNEDDGRRIAPWIASLSYGPLESESNSIVRGLALFGHEEFTRRSLDYFIQRYDPAGFLTTGYTLMGTGWHLWTLGEYYALYRNTPWLQSVAPQVARVATWITKQREKTRRTPTDGPLPSESGLMPPGVIADWNAFAYYFCPNGYYYAGLRASAEALADVGRPDAPALLRDAAQFREDIRRAYRTIQADMPVYRLRSGLSVPGYPSQLLPGPTARFFPGEDGNRSWCYDVEGGAQQLVPQGVLAPDEPDVGAMLDHLEDVQFLADGWFDYPADGNARDPFNFGGFSKVQPYYTRNAEIYALRDDVKPFVRSYFNTIPSLLNLENLSFQEHFNGVGAWNKTHETGYFLQQTRFMLVLERGDELWLAPLITDQWLKNGLTVEVRNAPTRMGPVSYRIVSSINAGFIAAHIDPPTRSLPKQIVLRLRHPDGKPIRRVAVNGQDSAAFDGAAGTLRIVPGHEPLDVRAEY